jgi:hypothetical protein
LTFLKARQTHDLANRTCARPDTVLRFTPALWFSQFKPQALDKNFNQINIASLGAAAYALCRYAAMPLCRYAVCGFRPRFTDWQPAAALTRRVL